MKLKLRIISFGLLAFFLALSTVSLIFYSRALPNGVVNVYSTRTQSVADDVIARMKAGLRKEDQLRPYRRKPMKKAVELYSSNYSTYDSNRAVELELNDTEYQELVKARAAIDLKSNKLGNPASKIKAVPTRRRNKPPYIEPCDSDVLISEGAATSRAAFPDLLQFLPPENNPSELRGKRLRLTLQEIHGISSSQNLTCLDKFHIGISDVDLYAEEDGNVEALLQNMATLPIVHVEEKQGGTQLKLVITFQDGSQALFKPMRFDRSKETEPNHFYFVDYERHTSEIAAFHLDRILGFRRCPPVVGRALNITTEIYAVAEDELIKTFFVSPAQNICFHGTCSYYCDTGHAICGRPDLVEGSLAAFLPPDSLSGRKSWKSPWRRSYHKRRKAEFERNPRYCDDVREQRPLYRNSKRLADLVDTHILDFLIGNMDRHHYETFKLFGNDSFILHLDHGRGFGRPNHDELSILAPLYQCCFVSFATFRRLLQIQHGSSPLSSLVSCSLSKDPVAPILLEKHIRALDRRLEVVLRVIKDCLLTRSSKDVFYTDSAV